MTIDLRGEWLCAQLTTGQSKTPGIGEALTRTRLSSRLTLTQDGDALSVSWRVVDLSIDTGTRIARAELSPDLVENMSILERPGRVHDGRLELDWAQSVMGAEVDEDESLPEEPDDPRVRDTDRDGEPGVTIKFRGLARGRVFAAQRTRTRLLSDPIGDERPTRIAGLVEWRLEQTVLGATNPLLKLAPTIHPIDERDASWFVMERESASMSDDQARERIETLFDRG
ncbi:MAG: hypothetical protein CMN30_33525 [Sandaracinus sp.]|nr:hypothetical protein [Sandaracinus sp.]|tara:strand:+ start:1762 stop:2442 length:681 start_codon:yes stop_codon:yes gene_type:complete